MTTVQLLIRSAFFYWRTNLAILAGVVVGTAVITGALVVGDSVRASLQQMSLKRLGRVDHGLQTPQFVREALAGEIARLPGFQRRFERIAPALMVQGSFDLERNSQTTRASRVQVYGVDDRLWNLTEHGSIVPPVDDDCVLSATVARKLGAAPGDRITLWAEIPSAIPRDSLLGERDETQREIPLTVNAVLGDTLGAAKLDLNPNQRLPLTAFVSLRTLQSSLGLADETSSARQRDGLPARINALFVQARSAIDGDSPAARTAADELTILVSRATQLSDLGLRLVEHKDRGYLSLESLQQILPGPLANAAVALATATKRPYSPVLVYLANEIANARDRPKFAMYSVVAGVELTDAPPFGPYEFAGGRPSIPLGSGDIIINDWLAQDLHVSTGDDIHLTYHLIGSHGELPEEARTFKVRGVLKLAGTIAADRGLVPEVKGITDAKTFGDWDQPFPMNLDRVTKRDEDYWEKYRTAPKAFVSLATAQSLWQSRYGRLTSLRLAPARDESLESAAREFTATYLKSLTPGQTGLVFRPIKFENLKAADGTTPFSALFIAFSFFLIMAATILIALLFRLGLEQRLADMGLLMAVGFAPKRVRRLMLSESLIVVGLGGLLGLVASVWYARLMIHGLTTWWLGAIGTPFLSLAVHPTSLMLGLAISIGVTLAAVWWATRQLRNSATRDLLLGAAQNISTGGQGRTAFRIATVGSSIAILLLLAAATGMIPSTEAFSGLSWRVAAFFVVGLAVLTASIAHLAAWLASDRTAAVQGSGFAGLARLAMRNAARRRNRSVMTVALIASATFVIVTVAAGRRDPRVEGPQKTSGNGGFTLVAESSTPVLFDLNTADGRNKLDFRPQPGSDAAELISKMKVMPFQVRPGENASCLNLYQTRLPTVLGVPQSMIERGGFKFADTPAANPWKLLDEKPADGSIPVLGDMNTLQYSLHKGIGDVINVPDDQHPAHTLRIAGMFDGSIFQGALLMSEKNFRAMYSERVGDQYFLIEVPPASADRLASVLETGLTTYGFDVERVADRLAEFLDVQNTYLSTFQALGGLGLLLGTCGLAAVMLRNILERRAELALMRAVGFRNASLGWMVVVESGLLLTWGLLAGTASALLAMLPHLTSVGAAVSWPATLGMLAAVFVVGMLAAILAVAAAVRTPVLATLRSE